MRRLLLIILFVLLMQTLIYAQESVYITEKGECYHSKDCFTIADSKVTETTIEKAIEIGKRPCKKCQTGVHHIIKNHSKYREQTVVWQSQYKEGLFYTHTFVIYKDSYNKYNNINIDKKKSNKTETYIKDGVTYSVTHYDTYNEQLYKDLSNAHFTDDFVTNIYEQGEKAGLTSNEIYQDIKYFVTSIPYKAAIDNHYRFPMEVIYEYNATDDDKLLFLNYIAGSIKVKNGDKRW